MSQVDDLLLNVYKLEALRQLALGNQTFPVPGEPSLLHFPSNHFSPDSVNCCLDFSNQSTVLPGFELHKRNQIMHTLL